MAHLTELHLPVHWASYHLPCAGEGFPDSSVGKESTCNAGDPGSIPGSGRSTGEGKGYPFQYSGLENSIDCIVHGAQRVRLDWATFTFSEADVITAIGMNVVLEDVRKLIQPRGSQGGFLEEVTLFNWDLKDEQEFAWEWKGVCAVMQKKGGREITLIFYWV